MDTEHTSWHSVKKWAKEAKALLKQGYLPGVKTNLTMIVIHADEEIKRAAQSAKKRTTKREPRVSQ